MFRITRARCRRAVIVLAVIGALLSPRGSSLVQAERPIDVSLIALIGNPAAFDAKLVRTEGFCWLQYDGNGVYVSREDFERGLTLIITP